MTKSGHPTALTHAIVAYEQARDALIDEMLSIGDTHEQIAQFLAADAVPAVVKLIAERPR